MGSPAVITTTLPPLNDMFEVEASDALEQWYYANSRGYKPDRTLTPLVLTPKLTAVDGDTGAAYEPEFYNVQWYVLRDGGTASAPDGDPLWPGEGWERVTAAADGAGVEYFTTAGSHGARLLTVKRNVPPPSGGTGGVALCCAAEYIDPRDGGVTYIVRRTVTLATNQDATDDHVTIQPLCPPSRKFEVLTAEYTDKATCFVFDARVLDKDGKGVSYGEGYSLELYYIDADGKEHLNTIDYPPITYATSVYRGFNALYAERMDVVFRVRGRQGLLPAKAYASVVWDVPKMDVQTTCDNGGGVDAEERTMRFGTIINVRGRTLTEYEKRRSLFVNYRRRDPVSGAYTDMGWGQTLEVGSGSLRGVQGRSVPVHAEVWLRGAYEEITHEGAAVTHNGNRVFERL